MSLTARITLALLIGLLAMFLIARHRYPGKASLKLQPEKCDPDLWTHIHEKERLRVIEDCTAAEGRVVSLHRASDGDLHIGLKPEDKSILNLINVVHARGQLVVEIICEHTPDDADDKAACGNYHPQITIPNVGDKVRITGAYVTDRDNSWNEIHPVTRIEVLH